MQEIKLKIKLKDRLLHSAKTTLPLVIVAMAAVIYMEKVTWQGAVFKAMPIIIFLLFTVDIFVSRLTFLTISKDGFTFTRNNLKNSNRTWEAPIELSEGKTQMGHCQLVQDTETKQIIYIPTVIFSYPEVIDYIKNNVPQNHKFRGLLK